jgi:glycosyl transferase family 25
MKNFIITLSKIPESLKTATDLKKQLESFGAYVELFEGTYGNDAVGMMEKEGRLQHPWGIKGPSENEEPVEPSGKMASPGVRGCFYSHYNLWKKCVDLNEPIAIWEDDIKLTRPYIPVEWKDVLVLALGHPRKSHKYMHYLEFPEGDPKAESYQQSSMPGCCGYAIKPSAAKKLLKTYKKTYLPADNAINHYIVNIEIHSHVMGIALIKKDGKKSLTRTNFWETFK